MCDRKEAGVPEKQAEAEALAEVFAEALETQLATKSDVYRIEKQLLIIKWMVAIIIVVEVIPFLKSYLG